MNEDENQAHEPPSGVTKNVNFWMLVATCVIATTSLVASCLSYMQLQDVKFARVRSVQPFLTTSLSGNAGNVLFDFRLMNGGTGLAKIRKAELIQLGGGGRTTTIDLLREGALMRHVDSLLRKEIAESMQIATLNRVLPGGEWQKVLYLGVNLLPGQSVKKDVSDDILSFLEEIKAHSILVKFSDQFGNECLLEGIVKDGPLSSCEYEERDQP